MDIKGNLKDMNHGIKNKRAQEVEERLHHYVLDSGRTVEEVSRASQKAEEELYLEAFARGLSLVYVDERCLREMEMVLARPDGGEDLIYYHVLEGRKEFLRELKAAGEGKYAYLLSDPRMEAFKTRLHG
jgi:DNA-binding transcriptional ArsR family regulator